LQTKHADKKMVNIDSIPDVKLSAQDYLQQPMVGYCGEGNTGSDNGVAFMPNDSSHDNNLDNLDETFRCFGTSVAGNVNNLNAGGKLLGGSGGFPLDLSKSPHLLGNPTLKYEPSESEISYSDSNNDESQDCFLSRPAQKQRNPKTPSLLDMVTDNDLDDSDNNLVLSSPASSSQGSGQQPNSQQLEARQQQQQKKRFRTPMSNVQIKILRILFDDIKMPTMIDCENIGREIGLSKRVIQVCFGLLNIYYKLTSVIPIGLVPKCSGQGKKEACQSFFRR
jgi:Homeodomain